MLSGFFAYPSQPAEIGKTITATLEALRTNHGWNEVTGWEENDIAGKFIVDPIFDKIDSAAFVAADITKVNFNVAFEIGYSLGRNKRLLLTMYKAIQTDNSGELAKFIVRLKDATPIAVPDVPASLHSPVYIVLPRTKTDFEIRLTSRIKKARLQIRTFDPEEQGRLSLSEALRNVALSYGVVLPLIASNRTESLVHNIRVSLIAGVCAGLDKKTLLIQLGDDPVPLDYRDLTTRVYALGHIDQHINDFALEISGLLQTKLPPVVSQPKAFLSTLTIGSSNAENEMVNLAQYFLETDEYHKSMRGEGQVVTGRKGSGKTALFVYLRDNLRRNVRRVVLDLRPEGFQLLKFKDVILAHLEHGTKEHTITAFWEYLLWLEICYKVLEKDQLLHTRNHTLYEAYRHLAKTYNSDPYVSEGDFAERIMKLTNRIAEDFKDAIPAGGGKQRLSSEEITDMLYKHDVRDLRKQLTDYLQHKEGIWILFDNLDKGWPPDGLTADDLIIIKCLFEAMNKLLRVFAAKHIDDCHGIVFLRNDVYELLLNYQSDRGKMTRIALDWTEPDMLRELLRRRLIANGLTGNPEFVKIWSDICICHVGGEEPSAYLIDRCLMRPRLLIDLVNLCKSRAVNLGHSKIDGEDIRQGEASFSSDLIALFSLEIRDIIPKAESILYHFIESPAAVDSEALAGILKNAGCEGQESDKITDFLVWYGVLGLVKAEGEVIYIYSVKYDMRRLKALINASTTGGRPVYQINPAFWSGLGIKG